MESGDEYQDSLQGYESDAVATDSEDSEQRELADECEGFWGTAAAAVASDELYCSDKESSEPEDKFEWWEELPAEVQELIISRGRVNTCGLMKFLGGCLIKRKVSSSDKPYGKFCSMTFALSPVCQVFFQRPIN